MGEILRSIGKSLQTDLADLARATIDPAFSARLDTANFEDKRFQRDRKIAIEDAENNRRTALADEAYKQQGLIQLKLAEEAIGQAKKGNPQALATTYTSRTLQPHIKEYVAASIRSGLKKDPELVLKEAANQRAYDQLDINERRLVLQTRQHDENRFDRDFWETKKHALNVVKQNYEEYIDTRNKDQSLINRDQWLNHIESAGEIFTEAELEEARSAMKLGDQDQVKVVYDTLWKRAYGRLQSERELRVAEVKANAEGMVPSAVTNTEFNEAEQVLRSRMLKDIESNPEMESLLDPAWYEVWFTGATGGPKGTGEKNKTSLIHASARVAKSFARDKQKGASESELSAAYDLAKGIGQDKVDGELIVDEARVIAVANRITNAGFKVSEVVNLADKKSISIYDAMDELGIK